MDIASIVWGLDIGHSSIKAVKLERGTGTVKVLGYAIEPIPSGDDVDRDQAVVDSLKELAKREEFRNTPVVCALSGRQVLSRSINVPIINENKVHRMVELEARQQIPGDFEDVRWGYHMTPGLDGVSNDVALFAARKEIVDDLVAKCKGADLNLIGISVTNLAVYNFVQYDQEFEDDESVIVLDVGAENTDLVVYQGDTLWMRSLGVSGNDITRTFMKKFRVGFDEAETLKCQVGDARQAERVLKVVESSLTELTSDVQRSLGFYKSQNADAKFDAVVVSGNTFKLPGLSQFMADRLGYAIITLIELERIEVTQGLDRDHFLEDLQSLGVAMGLGLQGLGVGKSNVNLLPSADRIENLLKQKRWAAIALLIFLPLVFAANYVIDQGRLDDANIKIKQMTETAKENDTRSKEARAISDRIPSLAPQVLEYQTYGEYIGQTAAIESGIFTAISALAADKTLLRSEVTATAWSQENGRHSPVPQAIYLESIDIPELRLGDRSPFELNRVSRTVKLKVRVPEFADRQSVINRCTLELSQIRQSQAQWLALNPSRTAADLPDELPKLFAGIKAREVIDYDEEWTFTDPGWTDQSTGKIVGKDYPITIEGKMITFDCVLQGQ